MSTTEELNALEEQARKEKLAPTIFDPIQVGKQHQVQEELLEVTAVSTALTNVQEVVTDQAIHAKEVLQEKTQQAKEVVQEKAHETKEQVEHAKDRVVENLNYAKNIVVNSAIYAKDVIVDATSAVTHSIPTQEQVQKAVEIALEKVGLGDGTSLEAVHNAEEKERVRRMSQEVDPLVAAKIHHVQDELTKTTEKKD